MARLSALAPALGNFLDQASGDANVSSLAHDSRAVQPGALFVCVPSDSRDTHGFLPAVAAAGAVAALTHCREGFERARELGLAAWLVPLEEQRGDTPEEMFASSRGRFAEATANLARAFYGAPSARLIAVTGTNGKTSIAWLIRELLAALGHSAAYLGTLGFETPAGRKELDNTTPPVLETYALVHGAQTEFLAMEVSSHALSERRVEGLPFELAVFSNFTQDHLDFHGSMEAYRVAKTRLFRDFGIKFGVFGNDDPVVAALATEFEGHGSRAVRYGKTGDPAVSQPELRLDRTTFQLGPHKVQSPLIGAYNIDNLTAAILVLSTLGFELEAVVNAVPSVRPVPGRLEPVMNDHGLGIWIDYAHTPDGLQKLLESVRPISPGARIWTVFGCGGDRDPLKRPLMGKIAETLSDEVIVTSDNPRTEDPESIVSDILKGMKAVPQKVLVDRREAVAWAVQQAATGDLVVIAGKGHENYQIIGATKFPLDDRNLVREGLALR